jgi:hypothetical protein
MAALVFQSIAVGRARIMMVLHTGIEQPLGMALVPRREVAGSLRPYLERRFHRLQL